MRIVLCDDGLRRRTGHAFNLAAALKEELARRGVELAIWCNASLPKDLRAELDAQPVFDTYPFVIDGASSRPRQLWDWLVAADRFRRGLRRARPRSGDVLLVPTARPGEILGMAAWLLASRTRASAVWLNFMSDDVSTRAAREAGRPFMPRLFRASFAVLRLARRRSRLVLSGQSEAIVRRVARAARLEVRALPVLKGYPQAPARGFEPPWRIGFLGRPRADKGSDALLRVVELCARELPGCRIVVQLPAKGPLRAPEGLPPNVEAVETGLARPRYFELLASLHVVVLPYDPRLFGQRTSGVFSEAVAYGCVPVVPAGTWMAEMLAKGHGAGVVFHDRAPERVAEAVRDAVADLPRLGPLALAAREPWRASQSMGAYVDQLLGALAELSSSAATRGKEDGVPSGDDPC
jgi:glycosyltransferase involved in cell wall biosynthesis